MLLRGTWLKWALVATGVLSTGCAGVVGLGVGMAFVGAGALAFTCYDRVSVVVTDRVTGTELCDAKVTFIKGSSKTEATSCYQAALSAGKYRLHVERRGLVPFDVPIEVSESGRCGQTVQTMYVALDRPGAPPQDRVLPPPAPPAPLPPPPAAPSVAPAPGAVPAPSVAPAPGAVPAPSAVPAPNVAPAPSSAPAPSAAPPTTAFPDAP
jgi:hypothetical protein